MDYTCQIHQVFPQSLVVWGFSLDEDPPKGATPRTRQVGRQSRRPLLARSGSECPLVVSQHLTLTEFWLTPRHNRQIINRIVEKLLLTLDSLLGLAMVQFHPWREAGEENDGMVVVEKKKNLSRPSLVGRMFARIARQKGRQRQPDEA